MKWFGYITIAWGIFALIYTIRLIIARVKRTDAEAEKITNDSASIYSDQDDKSLNESPAVLSMVFSPEIADKIGFIALLKDTDEVNVVGNAMVTYLRLYEHENSDTRIAVINRKSKEIIEEIDL